MYQGKHWVTCYAIKGYKKDNTAIYERNPHDYILFPILSSKMMFNPFVVALASCTCFGQKSSSLYKVKLEGGN